MIPKPETQMRPHPQMLVLAAALPLVNALLNTFNIAAVLRSETHTIISRDRTLFFYKEEAWQFPTHQ